MIKLLIVDDSDIIRSRIERVYTKNKTIEIVGTAKNGLDAFVKAQKLNPTLITMDLTMPSMDGISSIRRILKHDKNIKILVVSALSDVATGLEAIENGARGFLCKPFTDKELVASLDKVINTPT